MTRWPTVVGALFATLTTLAAPAYAGTVTGWRHDGTGHYDDATPPATWSADTATWSTALPGWSNATPVVVGGLVCGTSEPSTLFCADAATGTLRWQATNDVVDTLPPGEAATVRAQLAAATAAEAELSTLQREYSRLRREVRAGADVLPQLEKLATRMGELRTTVDAVAAYRTVEGDLVIGWSSPTPVTDGTAIWAFFANGVVSKYALDGTRVWTRWLGRHTVELRGYLGQPTASPRLAGGVLVVGYNELYGLDPATGATRWTAGRFADYGTPAVADVGGLVVVLTGDGRAVRARDGVVLQEGMGDLWYTGPIVSGDRAWWAGTTSDESTGATWPTRAIAWKLARNGDTIAATRLYDVQLSSRQRHYATATLWDGRLVTISKEGSLTMLDAATGAQLVATSVQPPVPSEAWASPTVVGGRLQIMFDQGHVLTYEGAGLKLVATSRMERGLASPVYVGSSVYVRGREHLFKATR
ncbi:MAG: PQQ-binding-like beta-propeller repeat protein [Alphaproteobacteria bacterium]|nr:PQQ-binding-like beta-propeller repeat protein [Alphaproteobacteria bacterium]